MFYEIPLLKIPAQELSTQINENFLTFRIKIMPEIKGVFLDLYINNEPVFYGLKPKINFDIIESLGIQDKLNIKRLFFFNDKNKNEIDYNDFNTSTRLYYET